MVKLLSQELELALGGATDRAYPIVGQALERCARGDAAVRVSFGRVIDVSAYRALVFLHF
jgi:hypothetical protein